MRPLLVPRELGVWDKTFFHDFPKVSELFHNVNVNVDVVPVLSSVNVSLDLNPNF